jgi:hypothetical protein
MTDHDRWRTLTATAMDFELSRAERDELDGHLRDCVACRQDAAGFRDDAQLLRGLDFGLAPAGIRSRLVAASGMEIATGPSAVLLFVGAILLILATFGAAIGVGSLVRDRDVDLPLTSGNRVLWQSDAFELQASDFKLVLGGDRYFATGPVTVASDAMASVQVAWHEHGMQMRLHVLLASDGREWWATEIQALGQGGIDKGLFEGISFDVPEIRRPLGTSFVGELALSGAVDPAGLRPSLDFGTLELSLAPDTAFGPDVAPGVLGGGPIVIAVPVPNPGDVAFDPNLRPVSLSDPGDAAAAIEACHVREFADQVIGMGRLASAAQVENYAPFSSNEPDPAWLVLFQGSIQVGDQALEGGVCLAFDDGRTLMPLAAELGVKPTLILPPLQP